MNLLNATAPQVIEHLELVAERCLSILTMQRKYPLLGAIDSCAARVMERRHSSTVRRLIAFKRWFREHPNATNQDVQEALWRLDIPRTDSEAMARITRINEEEEAKR